MWFYTMQSAIHGEMTVSDTDEALVRADRDMALADDDKSSVGEVQFRELTAEERLCL